MKRSSAVIWSTAGILLVAGSAAMGSWARVRLDVGEAPATSWTGPLLASNEASVDPGESDYFYRILERLKSDYYKPIDDEQKLAAGAVKGMINSLADPYALFMDKEEFARYESELAGTWEGIGVELRYSFDPEQVALYRKRSEDLDAGLLVPDLIISAVIPGSPGEREGLTPGDRVDIVNGRWVMSAAGVREFRQIDKQIQAGEVDSDKIERLRDEMRDKASNSMAPAMAHDLLTNGSTGEVEVVVQRGDARVKATIPRGKTVAQPVVAGSDGTIRLKLWRGAAGALQKALSGGAPAVIDLRNSTVGDYNELRALMEMLAPAGRYGWLVGERGAAPKALTTKGSSAGQPVKFIVDNTTRGAAEVLALALASQGRATLVGGATSGDRIMLEVVPLPDGSGYTLPFAQYRASAPQEARR